MIRERLMCDRTRLHANRWILRPASDRLFDSWRMTEVAAATTEATSTAEVAGLLAAKNQR